MTNKLKGLLLIVFLFSLPINASAQVISQTGSIFLDTVSYDSANDYYKVNLDPALMANASVRHRLFETSDFTNPTWDSTHYFPASMEFAYATYTCKKYIQDTFYDANGNEIGELKFYADQLVNPICETNYTPPLSDSPGGGGITQSCIDCGIFDCPEWQAYVGDIQAIKNAIPPAPNWQEVATTFNLTISPQIKSDLQQILGSVADPPPAPAAPTPPAMPADLDNGGITAPTGTNAPGLENSGFTENDIKDNAPVIEERQDDSGGFIINNPLDGLPSQEEFIQNSPIEGTADLPADPTELENLSPTPSEGDNVAPTPTEGDNTAPTPGDTGDTAPLPTEEGTAPLPNESGTAPLPTEDATAPLPGG